MVNKKIHIYKLCYLNIFDNPNKIIIKANSEIRNISLKMFGVRCSSVVEHLLMV